MGSSQSSEVTPPPASPPPFQQKEVSPSFAPQNPTPTDSDTTHKNDPPSNSETKRSTNQTKNKNLTGFALVQHKCRKHKRSYDKCYHQWYRSSFLGVQLTPTSSSPNNDHHNDTAQNASATPSRDDCDDLFEKYRRCIYKNLQKEREKQGLGVETLTKGSALREFREEEGFDDDK